METNEEWYELLQPAILIRVEDFHLLGYREIKPEHIWSFLTEKKWVEKPSPNLHERANDIMQMNIGQLMEFITQESKRPEENTHTLDQVLVEEVLHSTSEETPPDEQEYESDSSSFSDETAQSEEPLAEANGELDSTEEK
ncbi:hypothetical protein MFLO_08542 [Listeria floridensis FSL S10-1187]|uniref:Uncharacterized protein n=1 Tax=Listeria floridensis FSL S10-1187 TaxID=1265817 RepID=A0ABN0RF61_9LIST|nr:hypothetical protein MFLO_08542 [Listeria floridensis FSL S10-1187]